MIVGLSAVIAFWKRFVTWLWKNLRGKPLSILEKVFFVFLSSKGQNRCPPIFILGPPRSGTTVTMQALTYSLNLDYISNRDCYLYGAPFLGKMFHKDTLKKPSKRFSSKYGKTIGKNDPSECGEWWYRFFPRDPQYVNLIDASPRKMTALKKSVRTFSAVGGKPILFKNNYASLRILPLSKVFPNAIFVVVERNHLDICRSLLEARLANNQDITKWWSMKPENHGKISQLEPHEQVAEQVISIYDTIERDLRRAGVSSSRVFQLKYENLCDRPGETLNEFIEFLKRCRLDVANQHSLEKEFFAARKRPVFDEALDKALVGYLGSRQSPKAKKLSP